ncbi:MAG TPA: hypothetical protein VMQ50_16665 [Casimicrobiaceae bacterium]|nr:hypothetical protein [Casimicrobiaceae bacterium]
MLAFAGALLLVLGLISGFFLLLAPLGVGSAAPGATAWILFPGFTVVGFVLLAVAARVSHVSLLSRVGGTCLVLLALAAGVALFAIGNGLAQARGDTLSLWYVLGLGLALGGSGFAIGRASAGSEPAQT